MRILGAFGLDSCLVYSATIMVVLMLGGIPGYAQGNAAPLTLTLDRSDYCVSDPWNLNISNAAPNAAIRLFGNSNSIPWEIQDWATTNPSGSYNTSGKFSKDDQGLYQLSVEIGGVNSNPISFWVSSCTVWTPANAHLGDGDITSLVADPLSPNVVYAGTLNHGVFKSLNQGTDWVQTGLVNTKINVLVTDAAHPGSLYAGTDGRGLVLSTDSGDTWVNAGLNIPNVSHLMIDPRDAKILLAGYVNVDTATLFRSIDAGRSWNPITMPSQYTSVMVIDPVNPDVIYLLDYGFLGMEDVGYLRKTSDGGKSWDATNLHDTGAIWNLVIDPTASTTLYVYGYLAAPSAPYGYELSSMKSTDGAKTWRHYSQEIDTIIADESGALYATSQGAIYRSSDHGGSWNPLSDGTGWKAQTLAASNSSPGTIFAGTNGSGLYKDTGGVTLMLDRANYCVGDSWIMDIANAPPSTSIQLVGLDDGLPWTIRGWASTDQRGQFHTTGTYGNGNQGVYQIYAEIGGDKSNILSVSVADCR